MASEVTPFATVDELKARWPDFPPGADEHARVLLEDATQFILDEVPEAVDAPERTKVRVVCAVVRRAMRAEADAMSGVESFSEAAGPFNHSFKPVNPNGDFFLTRAEKRALGGNRQVAFGVTVADCGISQHGLACALRFGAVYCDCGLEVFGEVRYPVDGVR